MGGGEWRVAKQHVGRGGAETKKFEKKRIIVLPLARGEKSNHAKPQGAQRNRKEK